MVEQRQRRQTRESAKRAAAAPVLEKPTLGWRLLRTVRTVRNLLFILLAICVLGTPPAALAGAFFGLWHLPLLPAAIQPTATPAPDLALPRRAWAATRLTVLEHPDATTQPVAVLEPGFPVTLTEHQRTSSGLWSHIHWAGATHVTGREGWAPDTAFVAYGSSAQPLGDLGAFSPSLVRSLAPEGNHFAVALYFPATGYLYRTNSDQVFALGDGFRALLIAALLARGEAAHPPQAPPATTLGLIATGTGTAAATAYKDLGDAAALGSYLASIHVIGVQPAAGDWSGGQATANALLTFYNTFYAGSLLTQADRSTAQFWLSHSETSLVAAIAGTKLPGQDGLLVASVHQQGSSWTMSLCGYAKPARGPQFLMAAVARDQPSQDAAQKTLAAFFQQLTPLVAG